MQINKTRLISGLLFIAFLGIPECKAREESKPNFVIILCDDLGIGDVQCFNPEAGKIRTPNIDRLASEGRSFTDAHSASSVCTPTRYGLLTGRYSWRTKLQRGVGQGFEPCLIAKDRPTIGSFLQQQGYHTGIVGKWHLGMRFMSPQDPSKELKGKPFKFTAPVGATSPDGPIHRGFDYFFGIHHARSMKAIIENDKVIEHDDVINFLPRCKRKAIAYIKERAKKKDQPFFLYLPLGSPHTPIVPTKKWQGKSGLGDYADFVMQTDDAVGKVIQCLDDNHLSDNTLVVFASDNGCSRAAKIGKLKEKGHLVSARFRGSKADIWEGGHRIPFIAKWPGVIDADSHSNQLICLNDLFATFADCLSASAPSSSCEDSVSFKSALLGQPMDSVRKGIVNHSVSGHFAFRTKEWKLILAKASGGWSSPNEKKAPADWPKAQLYDMTVDSSEQSNLYLTKPNVASELLDLLENAVSRGRTTPGPKSSNDIDRIKLWKSLR
jgi:arylsulfatase A-like enzyme